MHKGWYKELDEGDENGFAQFGGYMEAKKAKLMKQVRQQAGTERHSAIFKGIAIYVNGLTKPPAEELKTLMGLHGGVYHVYQMPSTTHIIASNLPNVKINKLGPLPIIKPSWIEDSITLGRLLNYSNYLLYTNQSRAQPKINFEPQSPKKNDTMNTHNGAVNNSSKTASHPSFLAEFYGNSRLHLIATLGAEFKQYVNDLRAQSGRHSFEGLDALRAQSGGLSKAKLQLVPSDVVHDNCELDFAQSFDALVPPVNESALSFSTSNQSHPSQGIVMHIDMDCFFVSVGIRNRPELRGKPVAVTHSRTGHGPADAADSSSLSEIASCSYAARALGVRNGMFMGEALQLCPRLQAIPYDFDDYRAVAKTLYATIAEYTLDIEAVSCDEMYVNVAAILERCGVSVAQFAEHIRAVIRERTGCPCSAGFGANRLQARLATKRAKPDGYYHLTPAEAPNYLRDLPLAALPGVGPATVARLRHLGLETCGDAQLCGVQRLQRELGLKVGETVYEQAAGVDRKPLQYEHERKSVSAEVNYGIRFRRAEEAVEFLRRLAEEVAARLAGVSMRARCVTLKLMVRAGDAPIETAKYLGHGMCDSVSRSSTLAAPTDDVEIIAAESRALFEKLALPFAELRGVGIQLSRLEKAARMNTLLKNFLAKRSASATGESASENAPTDSSKGIVINSIASHSDTTKWSASKSNGNVDRAKGRGGPRKKQSRARGERSNVLTKFFKSTQKDRSITNKSAREKRAVIVRNARCAQSDIDLDVLQELPEDIRLEVMREYNLVQSSSVVTANQSDNSPSSQIADPAPNARSKAESASPDRSQIGFGSLSHARFMSMLGKWLQSHKKPLPIDVQMLGRHFREMATQRKIERLHVYVKYLHRSVDEMDDCEWHAAYARMCGWLQEGMLATYGSKLRVPEVFSCDIRHF